MTNNETRSLNPKKKKKMIFLTSLGVLLICGSALAFTVAKQPKEPVGTETSMKQEHTKKQSPEFVIPQKKSKEPGTKQKEKNPDGYLASVDGESPIYYAGNKTQLKAAKETYQEEQRKNDLLSVLPPLLADNKPASKSTPKPDIPIKPVDPVTSTPVIRTTNVVVERGSSFNPLDFIIVEDKLDSAPRVFIDTTGLDMNTSGTYIITVNAVNKFEKAAKPQTMTVTVGTVPTMVLSQESATIVIGTTFDPALYVTASDEQDGELTNQVIVTGNDVNVEKEGMYHVTYYVTNSIGFHAQVSMPVFVRNETPTLVANEIHHEINQPFNRTEGVHSVSFNGEPIGIDESAVVSDNVNPAVEGQYTQEFRVFDRFGKASDIVSRKVFVENEAPVIHGTKDLTLHIHDTLTKEQLLEGVTATDREDDRQGINQVVELDEAQFDAVDMHKVGEYPVTYKVTDSMGKTSTVTIKISVINDLPVISGVETVELFVGDFFDLMAGVSATDTEDGDVPVTVIGEVDTSKVGEYHLEYRAEDKDGGVTTVNRIVIVKEKESEAEKVVEIAKKYLGVPYVWGGTTPSGFDCSGLVQYVFKEAIGKDLPRVTTQQETQGIDVSLDKLEVGDLLFWGDKGNSSHVAIYIGNNEFIHAPTEGDFVKITKMTDWAPNFAKRVL